MRSIVAALAALCCINVANAGQRIPADEARATLEHRVEAYVRAITRNPGLSDNDSIVRWNTPLCPLVAGLAAKDAKILSAKVLQISSTAGAPLARATCKPNFIIVATSEPDQVLNAWYARDSGLFGDAAPALIHQFLEASQSRPVRVWYNIDMGRKAGMHNGHFVPSNTRAESSAFVGNTVSDFFSIFAIIDTNRTQRTTADQLAAYVAMAGLTNVDPDANLGNAPSILQLFATSAANPPSGLSNWDAAFLKALYHSDPTSRTQRFEIAQRAAHDISR